MLYPLKFIPVYKEIIWGGTNIKRFFGRNIPFEKTAESWEICARPDGMSVVSNGELSGLTILDVIEKYKEKLLGTRSVNKYGGDFPLLIKIIDANDRLSVQVHPDDEYARAQGEKNGKNELWYIIDAKPGAKLIYGLRDGVTKEEFSAAVKNGTVADTLREVPVAPGDALFIPAGTVHAILEGILIAEIQQNSNTTYRIYDWDRVGKDGKPRELHIDKALDVINFGVQPQKLETNIGSARRTILRGEYFNIDEIKLDGRFKSKTEGDTFYVLMNLTGRLDLSYDGGKTALEPGDTVLIPACLGKYELEGQSKLLLTWI